MLPAWHDDDDIYIYIYIYISVSDIQSASKDNGCRKIRIINFKDHRLCLNEYTELVFKCWLKGKLKLSWLGATEAPTLDKNKDIDFG